MNQRLGYRPALDGLRALSVVAVVLYHAHLSWIPGGFLGVEVFFVVSGFLITSILIEEHDDTGTTNLGHFWWRRARRLLPALFTMLFVVLVSTAFAAHESAPDFRRDVLPAVFYFSNWWQVYGIDQPYFAATVLPVLRHLWSLAVEEQWYLVWPIAAGWLLRRRTFARWVCALLALAVMIFTALWARDGDSFRLNWLYLGTVSRSSGLLVGAALAWWWKRGEHVPVNTRLGSVASIGLLALFATQHVDSVWLYRFGLPATTVVSALLVLVVLGEGWLARSLASKPMVVIGRRSYGLYLWHWPFFVFLDAHESTGRLLVALVVTVVVNEVVFRFIETPARRGELSTWIRRIDRRWVAVGFVAVIALASVSSVRLMSIEARNVAVDTSGDAVSFELPSVPSTTTASPMSSSLAPESTSSTSAPPTSSTTLPPLPRRIAVVGDSQAYALWINRPDGIEKVFDLTDGSIQGCGVYVEGVGVANGGSYRRPYDGCADFTDRWLRAAKKNDAQIALVVLGAWEILDLKIDGMTVQVGSTTADRVFEQQLRFAIDTLRTNGLVVALLEVPCYRPVDSWDDAIVDRGNDAHGAHLNDLMRGVVASYETGVYFVDGPDEWCDGSSEATDLDFRYDGVHVYRRGSKLVFETIADQLLRIPVPAD